MLYQFILGGRIIDYRAYVWQATESGIDFNRVGDQLRADWKSRGSTSEEL